MSMDELEQLRTALAEDLALTGKSLQAIRDMTKEGKIEELMPVWKFQRFVQAVMSSAAGCLIAMDCLMPKESPTIDARIADVIERWKQMGEQDKELVVQKFREAFTRDKK